MPVVESPDGFRWWIERPEDRLVLNFGEIAVWDFIADIAGKDKVFVDVGAHVGEYAIRMAKFFKEVIAVEPHPRARAVLEKNIELNGIGNITILPFAAGDRRGKAILHDRGGSSSLLDVEWSREEIEVDVVRLDDIIQKADVIKIDVEGYEGLVVKGAKRLIEACRPVLIIEHHENRGYQNVPLRREDIRKLLPDYVALNLDDVHWAYVPREMPPRLVSYGVACHWANRVLDNLRQGREWYIGLPETWWYGANPVDFFVAIFDRAEREPVWSNRIWFADYEPPPLNLEFDWDWLIILDACRYDYFKWIWWYERVEPRLAPDSCTVGFLGKMPDFEDAVVVTGHPFVIGRRDKFAKVIDAGFDFDLNTCPPHYITKIVRERLGELLRYPRRILWFLQPHHPHISDPKLDAGIYEDLEKKALNPQQRVAEMFRRAKKEGILPDSYVANLRLVLGEICELIDFLERRDAYRRIVITSDHGEGLGEPYREGEEPVWSHPCARKELELRCVPFVVIER